MIRNIWCLLLSILMLPVFSQHQEPHYFQITSADGLPSNEVYHVIQDRKGFIWFATDHGISRYDGEEMKHFTKLDGLVDNVIFKFFEDHQGRIWMSSLSGHICYIEEDRIFPYRFNHVLDSIFTETKPLTSAIHVDTLDGVHISMNSGYWHIDSLGNAHFPLAVAYPSKGPVLIINEQGNSASYMHLAPPVFRDDPPSIYVLTTEGGTQLPFPQQGVYENRHFSLKTKDGVAYLGFSAGLLRYQKEQPQVLLEGKNVLHISEDDAYVWASTFREGAFRIDQVGNVSPYLPGISVTSVLRDNEGGYWFTTLNQGVYYSPNIDIVKIPKEERAGNKVQHILATEGQGTFVLYANGWMDVFHQGKRKSVDLNLDGKLSNTLYTATYISSSNELFVGGTQASFWIDPHTLHIKHSISTAGFSSTAGKGKWWVGSAQNVHHYHESAYQATQQFTLKSRCTAMLSTDSALLIGTHHGLYTYADGLHQRSDFEKLRNCRIIALENWAGLLAIGTASSGMLIYDGKTITRYTQIHGLLDNGIQALETGPFGKLYVGSNKGITVFNHPKDLTDLSYISAEDGLSSNEIKALAVQKDHLWIGTAMGISLFPLQDKTSQKLAPQLFLAYTEVNGDTLPLDQPLRHLQKNITFHFQTVLFKGRFLLNYHFLLEGFDTDWQLSETPDIRYTSLEPGMYVLRAKAQTANRDQGEEVAIPFEIRYPWWQKSWFWALVIGALLLAAVIGLRINNQRIQRKNDILFQINALRTQAMQAQMNPHFLFNSLNSVHRFIAENDKYNALMYLSTFGKLVRETLDLSRLSSTPISRELDHVQTYLELEKLRFGDKLTFEIIKDPALQLDHPIPPMLIQPLVENSIIHGILPKSEVGKVEVFASNVGKKGIRIVVKDNGVGLKNKASSPPQEHQSVGLTLIRERLTSWCKAHQYEHSFSVASIDNEEGLSSGTLAIIQIIN